MQLRRVLLFPVILVFGIMVLMLTVYIHNSIPIFKREGIDILTKNIWRASENPNEEYYGVLSAIWGSIYTSLIAILLAIPLSISYAVFIVDYAPRRIKHILVMISDIMAGLPTILYGIWGAFVLVPFLKNYIMKPLYDIFSPIPIFSHPPVLGFSYLSAGVLLGFMVTPFASAIIREAYSAIPFTYREAAYSIGLTRYEATKILLGYIRPAIYSGIILAFGRAIGETVAVSLVIGNTFNLSIALFAPGYTISSLIANQFGNAFIYKYMTSALFAAGLLLFLIGLIVNIIGLYLLRRWEGYGIY
ncbi:ABC-type phosphate transport system, permease component [Pyrococcus sp. NA2]|uniref:phosphate ABC transporter permease subunit PstC n=1 Tax=Pyrococcus sp. (strain NA2) TaxID=342949 RepID=UPI000209AFB8|nr:phosphate ABC transporter permease subunit PstC [Pyrococcus sp. NA2]AEC51153.1 ABC-type phosphate transport system, permease component [Pyrococcus sp. NA2]